MLLVQREIKRSKSKLPPVYDAGIVDLRIVHLLDDLGRNFQPYDCVAISNPILEKVFLPIDSSTTFVSYFGHLNGYDAGYYGYAWADAIAADLATVFEKAKDGYLDKQAGLKLRREIYEPGDSR